MRDAALGGIKPYVLVRGRLEALLTRAVTYDLLELASPDSIEGQWEIVSNGARFVFDVGQ